MKTFIMMCFHEGSLYFSHENVVFQSIFTLLRRISVRAKVRNLVFVICSLLVGIYCVTGKSKVE